MVRDGWFSWYVMLLCVTACYRMLHVTGVLQRVTPCCGHVTWWYAVLRACYSALQCVLPVIPPCNTVLQGVTSCYRRVTSCYRCVTACYRRATACYHTLQRVAGVLQRVTAHNRRVTACYNGLRAGYSVFQDVTDASQCVTTMLRAC